MKSLAYRVISGALTVGILLTLPATTHAAIIEPSGGPVPAGTLAVPPTPVTAAVFSGTVVAPVPSALVVAVGQSVPVVAPVSSAPVVAPGFSGTVVVVEPVESQEAASGSKSAPVEGVRGAGEPVAGGGAVLAAPVTAMKARPAADAIPAAGPNKVADSATASGTRAGAGSGSVVERGAVAQRVPGVPGPSAAKVADLRFRLSVPGASVQGTYELTKGVPAKNRPGHVQKSGPPLAVTLKVDGRTRCGVLQMTTNGPADGIEWYTFASLCKPGTAAFRTEANRLPWSAGNLPSIRLCNGLSTALAEGDDCDDFAPPRGH